jgi:hypothetical protein
VRVTTTTTIPDDTLGASARSNFAQAATPNIAAIQDARDASVFRAGQAALPPIAPIQNAIDDSFRRANTEPKK